MNPTQRGYYIQLLAEAWDNTPIGHLRNEPELIRSLAGELDDETWENNHRLVLEQFKVRGKLIYNPRLVEERKKQEKNKMTGKKGGTTSANHRKQKQIGVNQTPTQAQPHATVPVEPKSNPSSSTSIAIATSSSTAVEEPKPSARKTRRAAPSPKRVTDATGETKHKRIEHMLMAAWEEHNPGAGKCPWGPDDGAQLKRMLEKTANWPDTSYAQCVMHLYATEGFPRSELPVYFLPRLPTYFQGPKDRYNREIGRGNGNGNHTKTAAAGRASRNVEALVRSSVGTGVQRVHVPDGGTVQPGTADRSGREERSVADGEVLAGKPKGT
ncbi:MAG TPA: hypothetical protein VGQ12_07465 [Candidatus Angelobacter sp.]|nr:hypothetical protein [Candidatus Angelobacter sp.]